MCGFGGELRFDGGRRTATRSGGCCRACSPRGPDGDGPLARAARSRSAHRRLKIIDLSEAGAQPMVDERARPDPGLQRLHLQLPAAARRAAGLGYRFFSTSDTEVILKAYHRWGADCVERFLGMFAFAIVEHDTGTVVLARDRLGIKPLYLAETPRPAALRLDAARAARRRRRRHPIDPVALHHYMTFHSVVPAPRTILAGVRKLPPATVRIDRAATARVTDDASTGSRAYTRDADACRRREEWQDAVLGRAAHRGRAPDGRRRAGRACCSPAASTPACIVALLAEQGQRGLTTFSIGFEAAGGESGDEFAYSDLIAKQFGTDHHQIRIGSRPLAARPWTRAVAAMSEPMVSHDCVAFYLLSRGGVASTSRWCSPGRARTRSSPATLVPAARRTCRATQAVDAYAEEFFDRPHADLAGQLAPEWLLDRRRQPGVRRRPLRPRRAPTRRSTRRCGWTPRSCSSTTRSSGSTT